MYAEEITNIGESMARTATRRLANIVKKERNGTITKEEEALKTNLITDVAKGNLITEMGTFLIKKTVEIAQKYLS